MSKFGELIDFKEPVLIAFFTGANEASMVKQTILQEVATAMEKKARVIRIDTEKNPELSEALRIRTLPTYILYKDGEMKWRQNGEHEAVELINVLREYAET